MSNRMLEPIQGYCNPTLRLKERMRRIKDQDRRMTESRIVEEALQDYLPRLEERFKVPIQKPHSRRQRAA